MVTGPEDRVPLIERILLLSVLGLGFLASLSLIVFLGYFVVALLKRTF